MILINKDLVNYICIEPDKSKIIDSLQKLLVKNGNSFDVKSAEAFDNSIESLIEKYDQPFSDWIISLGDSKNRLPLFLYARLMVRKGDYSKAIKAIEAVIGSSVNVEPLLLLHIVRLLVRTKQFLQATEYLKQALSLRPPYSFLIKCENLLQKIIDSNKWQPRLNIRIALLSSSTTSFLASVLKASCFRVGIEADVYEGQHGNYQQDILSSDSKLYKFKPQALIIVLNNHDLALSPLTEDSIAKNIANDLINLWTIFQKRNPCHLIQVGFSQPQYGPFGNLEDTQPGGRAKVVNAVNSLLTENLPSGVSFCDINRVVNHLGEKFHSAIDWYSMKQYPGLEALPVLADHLVSHLLAAFGYSAKVLVLDLDNTLWGGVIGEDGISGISLGPPSPEGEGYLDLQQYIKDLKERGVLLAVCSKNNLSDAELPFIKHDSTILKLDDFVVFCANWNDKASNIAEIAKQLSLGLDSFVFLDDNPLERSWVRSRLPDVTVPECGNKPWDMLASLRLGRYFETINLTTEDLQRHKSYKSNIIRQKFEKKSSTVEEFLIGLDMVVESDHVTSSTLSRVTQLINKTNQFNLTTRRYSEEQVREMAESPDWWTMWFKLKDKFGNHGLVGVILASKNERSWYIDTWLMSCRVLGRKMEEYMLSEVLQAALNDGSKEVRGEYLHTLKNSLVKNMYKNLGFHQNKNSSNYIFSLADKEIPICKFIRKL
jgi:FkbH-like protein